MAAYIEEERGGTRDRQSKEDEKKERSQSLDGQETGSTPRPQHNRYQGLVTQKTKQNPLRFFFVSLFLEMVEPLFY
jgi:hypothetical protein